MFRDGTIVNVRQPMLCLDGSDAYLGLAKFSRDPQMVIDFVKLAGLTDTYILVFVKD